CSLLIVLGALYLLSDWKGLWKNIKNLDAKALNIDIYLKAIIFFLIMIQIVDFVTVFLKNRFFKRTKMDKGTAYAVARTIKYLGWIATLWGTMAILGIDMKNLAIVFGALSVGIGFGLQNIVNNFVSGLLILFERPIKVGDWILVKGQEGVVKSINIRSTELETADGYNILIPNSVIISNELTNLTRDDTEGTLTIQIKISAECDFEKIEKTLSKCAKQNNTNKVVSPIVTLTDITDGNALFELIVAIDDVTNKKQIAGKISKTIWRSFSDETVKPSKITYINFKP
ncbi:MAG: mechanosensitive ion channel, partial [Alphaproteobacteria bacterium]|nr:mechanosensitive ion channel [Alphaproteobacteria bacterium]